jgi:hypothetical protein
VTARPRCLQEEVFQSAPMHLAEGRRFGLVGE